MPNILANFYIIHYDYDISYPLRSFHAFGEQPEDGGGLLEH